MRKGNKGSLSLACVDAFMATAAYESYAEASRWLEISPSTIMRRVKALEIWLRRVLIWEKELFPTEDGTEFVLVAAEVIKLVDKGGLRAELKNTRVHADGMITIGGEVLRTSITHEIGELLVRSRADVRLANFKPKTSANDPFIQDFLNTAFKGGNKF